VLWPGSSSGACARLQRAHCIVDGAPEMRPVQGRDCCRVMLRGLYGDPLGLIPKEHVRAGWLAWRSQPRPWWKSVFLYPQRVTGCHLPVGLLRRDPGPHLHSFLRLLLCTGTADCIVAKRLRVSAPPGSLVQRSPWHCCWSPDRREQIRNDLIPGDRSHSFSQSQTQVPCAEHGLSDPGGFCGGWPNEVEMQ
jgi:hypothetical protein